MAGKSCYHLTISRWRLVNFLLGLHWHLKGMGGFSFLLSRNEITALQVASPDAAERTLPLLGNRENPAFHVGHLWHFLTEEGAPCSCWKGWNCRLATYSSLTLGEWDVFLSANGNEGFIFVLCILWHHRNRFFIIALGGWKSCSRFNLNWRKGG